MTLIEMINDPFINAIMQGALAALTAGLVIEIRVSGVDKILNMILQVFGAMLGLIMMFSVYDWGTLGIWQIVWVTSFLFQLTISWAGAKIDQIMMRALNKIRTKEKHENI